ncbi:MAG: TonB-dependent receptor [Prolixibacteraceae bacterium]|nr:TonB-dependent receptor [Prolixibacteraceae bacterium]
MKTFFYIFLFLFCLNGFSQTVITGKVIQEKGEPMPGANAYLQGTYDGASSGENGEFKFRTSKTGQQTLLVEFMGYEPFSLKVELKGDTIRLNVKLKEAFNELNAVTITAGTFEASDKKQAVTITPIDMVTTAGAVGDVYGALQSLPGTTVNGESGRLFVKGGDSEESQTYIDGSLVSVPYNSSAPNLATRGRFNPFMFKGTIFSTGGYSAEYGQALSSVLLLNTNDMPVEDQLDLSVLSVGAEVAGTKLWKNGAVTGTLSYNNLAPYMSLTPQNYDWGKYPESVTGAVSVRQKTSKTGMFKFYSNFDNGSFTLSQQNPDAGGTPTDYKLDNGNQFVNASWNDKLGEKWAVSTATSFTNNTDDIQFEQTTVAEQIQGTHLKSVFSYPFSEKFILKMGGELFSKKFSQNVQMPNEKHDNSFTNNTFAGFTEAQIYASTKFVTRVGGRVEYSDYLNSFTVSPRFSAAYKITDKSQFSAAYGWFYQNPVDDYLLYTDLLKPERADHYTFSFQSSVNSRTIRVELYYKDYKDLVKFTGGEFYLPTSYNNSGKGYAKGLDLFWRDKKTIKNGDYWISYSYLDTKRDYRNFPEEAIPTFASKHNFSMVYKHWFGNLRSLAGANFRYSSPRVFNDPNSPVFNGEKMLAYRSLDLSWSFLYRQHVIIYGAVTNVLDFKNEFGQRYSNNPDANGNFQGTAIQPGSNQFYVLGCFITLTRKGNANQLDKIE